MKLFGLAKWSKNGKALTIVPVTIKDGKWVFDNDASVVIFAGDLDSARVGKGGRTKDKYTARVYVSKPLVPVTHEVVVEDVAY